MTRPTLKGQITYPCAACGVEPGPWETVVIPDHRVAVYYCAPCWGAAKAQRKAA